MIKLETCCCGHLPIKDFVRGHRYICLNCDRQPHKIRSDEEEAAKDWNFFINVITGRINCPKWMTRETYEEEAKNNGLTVKSRNDDTIS